MNFKAGLMKIQQTYYCDDCRPVWWHL